jgi:hypothetical protein
VIGPEAGQFIDLAAFAEWAYRRGHNDLLPDWRTIRSELPQLVAENPTERRRLFITHRWDSPTHPDHTGWQRQALRDLGVHYAFRDSSPCFWYDFMSLPQKPRLGEEKAIFSRGLNQIRSTVRDCENISLVSQDGQSNSTDLAAMVHRGWVLFELLIARNNMKRPLPLYQRAGSGRIQFGRDQQYSWDCVVDDIATLIPFDSAEVIHAWFRMHDVKCTNGSDLTKLAQLLHKDLTEKRHPEPDFELRFDREMRLTHEQLSCLEILESNRLSGCYPGIYVTDFREADNSRMSEIVWLVSFARRPPLPPLNTWVDCREDEQFRRRISATSMTSPMYPGMVFEFDPRAIRMRALLARPVAGLVGGGAPREGLGNAHPS